MKQIPFIEIRTIYCSKCGSFQRHIMVRYSPLTFHKVEVRFICLNEECDMGTTYVVAEYKFWDILARDTDQQPCRYL